MFMFLVSLCLMILITWLIFFSRSLHLCFVADYNVKLNKAYGILKHRNNHWENTTDKKSQEKLDKY